MDGRYQPGYGILSLSLVAVDHVGDLQLRLM